MRAILFFILVVIVFFLIRFIFNRIDQFKGQVQEEKQTNQVNDQDPKMVTCEFCGVHLPENEALGVEANLEDGSKQKKYFCSQDHLEQFVDQHSSN